jgi:hypothetical protein
MMRLPVVLLCAAAPLVSCKKADQSTPGKPESGGFVQNTYRNDFFGFSYLLPKEWHRCDRCSLINPDDVKAGWRLGTTKTGN